MVTHPVTSGQSILLPGVQLAAGGVSGDLPEETWVRSDTGWLEEGDGHGRFVVLTGPDGGNWRRLLEELFISGGGVG